MAVPSKHSQMAAGAPRFGRLRPQPYRALPPFLSRGRCALSGRYDWQQQVGRLGAAEMERGDAVEDLHRAVGGIVVQERSAAGELVLEIRQLAAAAAAVFVILAADRQPYTVALRHDDRCWPDFDIELGD